MKFMRDDRVRDVVSGRIGRVLDYDRTALNPENQKVAVEWEVRAEPMTGTPYARMDWVFPWRLRLVPLDG